MSDTLQLIRSILLPELSLAEDQVMLYNQRFELPPDDRMYVTLAILGTKTFGAATTYENDPVSDVLREVQRINRQEMISILLFSASREARERNWEVAAALTSTLAQQVMEANSFSIGRVPTSMTDVSEVDGTTRLNRYSLTFNVLVGYTRAKPVPFFDKFGIPPLVHTNQ